MVMKFFLLKRRSKKCCCLSNYTHRRKISIIFCAKAIGDEKYQRRFWIIMMMGKKIHTDEFIRQERLLVGNFEPIEMNCGKWEQNKIKFRFWRTKN
jgi:hypothetical protein